MSETVFVTIGGNEVPVIVEGGNAAAWSEGSDSQAIMIANEAKQEAGDAKADAQTAESTALIALAAVNDKAERSFHNVKAALATDLYSYNFPNTSPAQFRVGDGGGVSSGDEFGNRRANVAAVNNSMSTVGAYGGDGSQWVMHIGGYVPTLGAGVAPPFSEQKGGLYVSARTARDSNNTSSFSDLTAVQINTNIADGAQKARTYGLHVNATANRLCNGQIQAVELELNQIRERLPDGTPVDPSRAQPDLFADDQKTVLALVPLGDYCTKGLMFGVNSYGAYHTMMYTEMDNVLEAIEFPIVMPSGRLNYGGSFYRIGEKYRQTRIASEVVETIGHVWPRHSPAVVRHIKKDAVDAYDLWEMLPTGGNGWVGTNYIVKNVFGRGVGVDRATREFRISKEEGGADANTIFGIFDNYLNLFGGTAATARGRMRADATETAFRLVTDSATNGTYFTTERKGQKAWSFGINHADNQFRITAREGMGGDVVMAAADDRVGWFGSSVTTGGDKHHYIPFGTVPASVTGGGAFGFTSDGKMYVWIAGIGLKYVAFEP